MGKHCKENQAEKFCDSSLDQPGRAGALYVHVPLCLSKCRYCDFYSLPAKPGQGDFVVSSLLDELAMRRDSLAQELRSIFVGGGTPTALGAKPLEKLLGALAQLASPGLTEFTVEANPATVDNTIAAVASGAGVNRVSLGAQSFDAGQLKLLGRRHQPGQIGQAFEMLRRAGIENISLDLIYGIPGQSASSWLNSLAQALSLGPSHVSCYSLSFEPGTELFDDRQAGRVAEVDDETQREMYYRAIDHLAQARFEHYEISNFAKPARQCEQNLTYWRNREYLGIGPAACSYLAGERRTNLPDLHRYIENIERGIAPPNHAERIVGRDAMAETLMLGLRLIEGVAVASFAERFGQEPQEIFPRSFERYISLGAVERTATHLRIGREFLFTADTILADILAEA